MISQRFRRLFRAVLGGFLIGSSLIGYAQDADGPGVVRITDARPKGVPAQTVSYDGHGHKIPGQYHPIAAGYGGVCPTCNGVGCPACNGNCPGGYGKHGWHGHGCYGNGCYGNGCYGHGCFGHCWKGKFQEHYCSYAPDYGFSVPAKTPIFRRGVQYNQYFPTGWYGMPNGGIAPGVIYPTVYQPTDTTQLGFYYQHVPFWQPNPNALPPRPIPVQWHVLAPAAALPWAGGWGGGYCPPGGGWVDGSTATPSNGSEMTPTPSATDQPPQPVPEENTPAPPPNDSARSPYLRRASYQE